MPESRTSLTERRAIERVLRRAVARRRWGLVEALFNELGDLLEEGTAS
jgi:hypothetical protein